MGRSRMARRTRVEAAEFSEVSTVVERRSPSFLKVVTRGAAEVTQGIRSLPGVAPAAHRVELPSRARRVAFTQAAGTDEPG